MGQRVEHGYMAGKGPAVVVIQEWWGLVPHIEDVVERFAKERFLAIAPDLYHGNTAKSPDEAQRMLMELDAERAEREIAAAGESLLGRPECTSKKYGVIGFCMGGALAQYVASKEPKAGAAVSFYGGFKKVAIDWNGLSAPILLIYGEDDKGVPPDQGRELEKKLKLLGKNVEVRTYPGANHAFFNDTGRNYKPDAAADAWKRAVAFLREHVR
ncbi:MAG: dienelactone hydrolase family protein [Thermoanaerobaculia bacterium]